MLVGKHTMRKKGVYLLLKSRGGIGAFFYTKLKR